MSTKTTLKRIALVAVSALGFGLLSIVPSQGATVTPPTSNPVVGTANRSGVLTTSFTSTIGLTTPALTVSDTVNFSSTAVTLTVPATSGVTLADNNGATTGGSVVFSATGATTSLVASVSTTTGAVTAAPTANISAGAVTLGTVTIVPDVAGAYTVTLTTTDGATAVARFYATSIPTNTSTVPFAVKSDTGVVLTDSYLASPGSYTASVRQISGTGNFVQLDAISDGVLNSTYTFSASGVGAVSGIRTAVAAYSWVPGATITSCNPGGNNCNSTGGGAPYNSALTGATLSATGANGNIFRAKSIVATGELADNTLNNAARKALLSDTVKSMIATYGFDINATSVKADLGNFPAWGTTDNAVVIYDTGVSAVPGALYIAYGAGIGQADAYIRVSVPTAGTTTLSITQNITVGGVVTAIPREVITVTGVGAPTAASYSFATVTPTAGTNGFKSGTTLYAKASDTVASVASMAYQAVDSAGNNITNPLLTPALEITISGVGSLSTGLSEQYRKVTAQTWTAGTFDVYSDGRPGTGTVTVKAGDTVVATQKIIFYGAVDKIQADAVYSIGYANGVGEITGSTDGSSASAKWSLTFKNPTVLNDVAIAILATDKLGNPVPVSSYTVTNSNPFAFTGSLAGSMLDSGNGLYTAGFGYLHATFGTTAYAKSGDKGTLTYSFTNSDGSVVTSNVVNLSAGGKPATVTVTASKSEFTPGERGYFLTTVKDASGNPTADNVYWTNFYAATPSVSGAFTWTTSVAAGTGGTVAAYGKSIYTVGGELKSYFYAPIASGTYTVKATTGSDFATAGQGVAIVVPITVTADAGSKAATEAANAAADAALQAIDAANAATDAANMAAEAADAATMAAQDAKDAADAATAAVEKLAQDVAAMIDALKAQLKTLANIVAKIAKKVKA